VRIVYLGTPEPAVPPLRALHAAGHEIALVVTQPDRRRSRGAGVDPSPVKAAALELGLEVRTPEKASEVTDEVAATGAQLGVVVAFGQILRPALLAALPDGFVNVHFSLLPRWRGAAPVERAILAGDAETGVAVMRMEEGLDTGPVFAEWKTAIGRQETAGELSARLVTMACDLLVEVLPEVPTLEPRAQEGEATYAKKLDPEEFRLDFTRPAQELQWVVQAGNPRPGAFTTLDGKRVKVLRAHRWMGTDDDVHTAEPGTVHAKALVSTGAGVLKLDEVQPEGKKAMAGDAWLAGARAVGHRLGT
jgi:methionyl-tRNA formyltransferase